MGKAKKRKRDNQERQDFITLFTMRATKAQKPNGTIKGLPFPLTSISARYISPWVLNSYSSPVNKLINYIPEKFFIYRINPTFALLGRDCDPRNTKQSCSNKIITGIAQFLRFPYFKTKESWHDVWDAQPAIIQSLQYFIVSPHLTWTTPVPLTVSHS